jgi:RNA polymerase sigma factor (TIGR02999 family)
MDDATGATRVTALLEQVREGDDEALDRVFPLIYDELQILARRQRRRWRGDFTLNTTALVHEAYLKLVGRAPVGVRSRGHFFALASRAMRHILCNYSRDRRARKRGGDLERIPLEEELAAGISRLPDGPDPDLLAALDGSLSALEEVHPRPARVVECRFFGGMTVEETSVALEISPRTVKRDWQFAQAWLQRDMDGAS